jgi:hypothetical protein
MYRVFRYDMAADNTVSAVFRQDVPDIEEDDLEFTDGVQLGELPVLRFTQRSNDRGVLLDYVPSIPSSMLVSARLKEVLDSTGVDNVDYYPAEIVDEATGKVYRDYYAANIIGIIACLDMEKSDYVPMTSFPDAVLEFKEMHLDYSKVHGARLFRLHEKSSIILIHESIAKALQAAGLRGFKLPPAEGYSGL